MKLVSIFSASILLTLMLACCATEPEEEYSLYKIKIDKITVSDTVSIQDTLKIKLDGTVGPDGCHSLKGFEIEKVGSDINITAWGSRPNFSTICPTVMVYLNGKECKVIIYNTGEYKINIRQPDNTIYSKWIYVNKTK